MISAILRLFHLYAWAAAWDTFWTKKQEMDQQAQTQIVQEMENEIAQVDQETDTDQLQHVVDLGLVQPKVPDSGGTGNNGECK